MEIGDLITYEDWIDAYYDSDNESNIPFIYNDKIWILDWDSINSAFYDFGHDTSLQDIGDKWDYLIEISLEDLKDFVIKQKEPSIEDYVDLLSKIKTLSNCDGDLKSKLKSINELICELLPDLK